MAAATIKLGAMPKTFKQKVTIQMIDGTEASIVCEYKYRDRAKFGEFIDGIMAAAGETKADDGKDFSMAKLMEKSAEQSGKYLMDILEGWNLDVELNLDSCQQLANELPGAAAQIIETYRAACTEGRVKN